jgi:hypothetical protein
MKELLCPSTEPETAAMQTSEAPTIDEGGASDQTTAPPKKTAVDTSVDADVDLDLSAAPIATVVADAMAVAEPALASVGPAVDTPVGDEAAPAALGAAAVVSQHHAVPHQHPHHAVPPSAAVVSESHDVGATTDAPAAAEHAESGVAESLGTSSLMEEDVSAVPEAEATPSSDAGLVEDVATVVPPAAAPSVADGAVEMQPVQSAASEPEHVQDQEEGYMELDVPGDGDNDGQDGANILPDQSAAPAAVAVALDVPAADATNQMDTDP